MGIFGSPSINSILTLDHMGSSSSQEKVLGTEWHWPDTDVAVINVVILTSRCHVPRCRSY